MKKVKSVVFETNYFRGQEFISDEFFENVISQDSALDLANSIEKVCIIYDDGSEEEFTTEDW